MARGSYVEIMKEGGKDNDRHARSIRRWSAVGEHCSDDGYGGKTGKD